MAAPQRRIVGVSTKMYFSAARTKDYMNELLSELQDKPNLLDQLDVFVIPDHITIMQTISQLRDTRITVGAQDAFSEDQGAYTGEVSPAVLAEVGVRILELGHAERRCLFGETDRDVGPKAAAAVRNGIVPLVCIGEQQLGDSVAAAARECRAQVEAVMQALPDDAELVLAYEPVWAIGAKEPAGADYVVGVTREVRELQCLRQRKGITRVLYGGSAGPGLFEKLKEGVDGLFLGRFAHDPKQFVRTIQEIANA